MIWWVWLIPTFILGQAFGFSIAALMASAGRDDDDEMDCIQ